MSTEIKVKKIEENDRASVKVNDCEHAATKRNEDYKKGYLSSKKPLIITSLIPIS